ncbi:MAG: M23 family metallopeptidase [Bacteroidales bacterium]|nr:M23 family metallopeptidase [Bacteroidales bacterium]
MSRHKYKSHPESHTDDRVSLGFGRIFLRCVTYVLAFVAVTCGLYIVYASFFDSPKERRLKRELLQMQTQYELISKKMDQVEDVLGDLQQRDNSIYRAIFELSPEEKADRLAGQNRLTDYRMLEGSENTAIVQQLTERINRLTQQVYAQSKSYDEIIVQAQQKDSAWVAIPAIQPVAEKDLKYISSGFGMRMHPIYKIMRFHYGLDFSAPIGTEVYATADGRVTETDLAGRTANGLKIVVDHGNGYLTHYAHLSRIIVRVGQTVKRGQVIGLVGNTGGTSGPHLHYEVHKNGKAVNPINYFFNDLSPKAYAELTEEAMTAQSFD